MHNDKHGYEDWYTGRSKIVADNPQEFIEQYERRHLHPFYKSKTRFDGAESRSCLDRLAAYGAKQVVDAGSGGGELSIYLACKGYEVTGVEISEQGTENARALADKIGVECNFVAASLEDTGLADGSIDAIVGFNTLHHFIKYPMVPTEFRRILKPNSPGLFVDPYSENLLKRPFHDKEQMERLGDTLLNKDVIAEFFDKEQVILEPSNWFTSLDKLLVRTLPKRRKSKVVHRLADVWHKLDSHIPANRATLWLSGSVVTEVLFNADRSTSGPQLQLRSRTPRQLEEA